MISQKTLKALGGLLPESEKLIQVISLIEEEIALDRIARRRSHKPAAQFPVKATRKPRSDRGKPRQPRSTNGGLAITTISENA